MALDTSGSNPNMDYNAHNATYASFLRLSKIGIVALVILLVAMWYFLVP